MRALVILVLAGCLLWLALQGFRSVRASEPSLPEPRGGYLLPPRESAPATRDATPAAPAPQPAPAAATAESRGASSLAAESPRPAAAVPAPPAASDPKPSAPAAAPAPAKAPAPPAPRPSVAPDEVGVASLLLFRPREVPAFLEGAGSSLPAERKRLAIALHHLVLGADAEARRLAEDLASGDFVRAEEAQYLRQALASPETAAASDPAASPMVLAAELSRLARRADEHLAAGRHREAALAYGELLLGALDAPFKAERESLQAWSDSLARAETGYRWNAKADWPAVPVKVEPGDSLISVRKRALDGHPDLLVCTGQISRANGIGGMIHPGDVLKVPTAHANVLVDLDSHWALYRLDAEVVAAWEIGVGKPGSETPPGEYRVGEKTEEPMWFRAGHAPVPFGDPENPLGTRWIAWMLLDGKKSSLGFHGTSEPTSIGEDQSQGCVRMRKAAIEELYEILPRGAVILVRP